MIVVRDVFQIKYGHMREAKELWIQAKAMFATLETDMDARIMVDFTGPAYTLVFESTFPSVHEWETMLPRIFANPVWQEWYHKFTPLVDSGHREMYTLVE